MTKLSTRITAIALLALSLVGAARAAPSPTASATATGTMAGATGTIVHRQEVSVSWSLGAGEYACAIRVGGTEGERVDALSTDATSWNGAVGATPGTTIAIEISYVAIPAGVTVQPSDACFRARSTATTTTTAQTFTPPEVPAPAPPADEPVTASAPAPTPTEPAPEPTVDTRVTELEAALAAIAARVTSLENATLAAWTALVDSLAAGAPPYEAALAARSAYLNTIYGL